MKSVLNVYRAGFTDYDGLDTYRVMPTRNVPVDLLDPFIFLNHHGPQEYYPENNGLPFGPHPHKGFETVTFILEGDLVHKDNTGYTSNIKAGGIQWMTAGKGIIHSETSSDDFKRTGGNIEILQLWINLPSRLKQSEPAYTGLQDSELPKQMVDDGKVTVKAISGNWLGQAAPIQSISNVHLALVQCKPSGTVSFPIPAGHQVLFYVIRGSLLANETLVETNELAEFNLEEGLIEIKASEDSLLLIGHAEPTHEPVIAQGPFVMNTYDEIRQAFVDYNEGRFGEWRY